MFHLKTTIDSDGVVDRGEDWKSVTFHAEQAIAKALIVLNKIELVDARAKVLPSAETECERLGE